MEPVRKRVRKRVRRKVEAQEEVVPTVRKRRRRAIERPPEWDEYTNGGRNPYDMLPCALAGTVGVKGLFGFIKQDGHGYRAYGIKEDGSLHPEGIIRGTWVDAYRKLRSKYQSVAMKRSAMKSPPIKF